MSTVIELPEAPQVDSEFESDNSSELFVEDDDEEYYSNMFRWIRAENTDSDVDSDIFDQELPRDSDAKLSGDNSTSSSSNNNKEENMSDKAEAKKPYPDYMDLKWDKHHIEEGHFLSVLRLDEMYMRCKMSFLANFKHSPKHYIALGNSSTNKQLELFTVSEFYHCVAHNDRIN